MELVHILCVIIQSHPHTQSSRQLKVTVDMPVDMTSMLQLDTCPSVIVVGPCMSGLW